MAKFAIGFVCVVFCVVMFFPNERLFGAGEQEIQLNEANRLLSEGMSKEALDILLDIAESDPSFIAQIENQTHSIRDQSRVFLDSVRELSTALASGAVDAETSLALFNRVAELNIISVADISEVIQQGQSVIDLNVARADVSAALENGQRLYNSKNYVDLLRLYIDGMAIYQDTFAASAPNPDYTVALSVALVDLGEPDDIVSSNELRERLIARIGELTNNIEQAIVLYSILRDRLSDFDPYPENGALASLEEEVAQYAGLHSQLSEALIEIVVDLEIIQGYYLLFPSTDNVAFWYSQFVALFAGDTVTESSRGNIRSTLTAMERDAQVDIVLKVFRELRVGMERLAIFRSNWDGAGLLEGYNALLRLSNIVQIVTAIVSDNDIDDLGDILIADNGAVFPEISDAIEGAFAVQSLSDQINGFLSADTRILPYNVWVSSRNDQGGELDASEYDVTARINSIMRQIVGASSIIDEYERQLIDASAEGAIAWYETIIDTVGGRYAEMIEEYGALLEQFSSEFNGGVALQYQDIESRLERAILFIGNQGTIADDLSDGAPLVIASDPVQSRAILNQAFDDNQNALANIDQHRAIVAEYLSVFGDGESIAVIDAAQETDALYQQLLIQDVAITTQIEQANENIATAADWRDVANATLAQTRQALSTNQLDRAIALWDDTRAAYVQALEFQDDAELRDIFEEISIEIGVAIKDAQNQEVVRSVRVLIGQIADALEVGDTIGASALLDEAENLWAQTNVEDNPELVRQRRFFNVAEAFGDRLIIDSTDPLYPVISNYLNTAKRYYSEARDQIVAFSDTDAEVLVEQITANLENVIALRPYNWEARLLELELAAFSRPDELDRLFEIRYRNAIEQRQDSPSLSLLLLRTLETILPNNNELLQDIYELEIELGLRQPPIDRTRIARSDQLLAEALVLIDTGTDARILAAISLLEEAVILNPDNIDAQIELDTLRILRGGESNAALSVADEQLFQRSQSLFVRGSLARAFAIVDQLWDSEVNRRYPPLIALRDRIVVQLGI